MSAPTRLSGRRSQATTPHTIRTQPTARSATASPSSPRRTTPTRPRARAAIPSGRSASRERPHDVSRRLRTSASPESSLFGMKLQAGLAASRRRNDETSRLEMRTIAEETPSLASRSATANPSRSGSWTSSSTISGRSSGHRRKRRRAVRRFAHHVEATASRSARAAARKPAWSSTISTVRPIERTVADAGRAHIGALPEHATGRLPA